MINWKTAFGITCLGLMIGCASSDASRDAAPVMAPPSNLIAAVPPQGLPPQKLEPGQCGLFLWGQATPRRFTFFVRANSERALLLIGDQPVEVQRMSSSGGLFGEFTTATRYQSISGDHSVDVMIVPGELLEDGQRIDSGRIVVTDREGWETILPVLGARACIPG